MKKLSNLELSELLCYLSRQLDEIQRFSHIENAIPTDIKKAVNDAYKKACDEQARREDEE